MAFCFFKSVCNFRDNSCDIANWSDFANNIFSKFITLLFKLNITLSLTTIFVSNKPNLLDNNFKEIERFEARCRLPKDRVSTATALCINKSNVDLLTKGNFSHYQLIGMIEEKFLSWAQKGPLTFLGYSSINFDDEVLRKEFFKSLRNPYLTNTGGNVRHDALNIVRAAFAIDDEVLKTELNDKGNKSMKLESLSRLNGIDSAGAHNALFDTVLTVKLLDLIKNKQPNLWPENIKTSSKVVVENIVQQEQIITLNEYFYGKSKLYATNYLAKNTHNVIGQQ